MATFKDFQLLQSLQSTLKKLGFYTPTEIQHRALPAMLQTDSVVGIAETGSGKTLAYTLPVLNRLKQLENDGDAVTQAGAPRAVILLPGSDLGEQVSKVFKQFTHETRLRVRVVLGSMSMSVICKNVNHPFEILIATPGRLEQLLERDLLTLADVRLLVFDEADQILDQGFLPVVKRILRKTPSDRQLALFSATASKAIQDLIQDMFSEAHLIETQGKHRLVSSLETVNCEVPNGQRFPLLEQLLEKTKAGGTLMFANTREQCDKLANQLKENGYDCAIYRGDMDKKERRSNLQSFREGDIDILICTDLAARGLDVECVDRVINYHLPREMKNYLHRAGRTARAGRKGTVYNFVTDRDRNLIDRLKSVNPLIARL